MPQPDADVAVEEIPDCDRCDDTYLDPDAYTVTRHPGGAETWTPVPCTACRPDPDDDFVADRRADLNEDLFEMGTGKGPA